MPEMRKVDGAWKKAAVEGGRRQRAGHGKLAHPLVCAVSVSGFAWKMILRAAATAFLIGTISMLPGTDTLLWSISEKKPLAVAAQ